MLSRRTLLLKPMQAAASGYARLHTENGRTLVQLHARGLPTGETRLFVCTDGHTVREIGKAPVNAHGEASLETEAPEKLESLFLIGTPPKPLLIGQCAKQDAGSLLSAKNTALALCERLTAAAQPQPVPAPRPPAPAVRPVMAVPQPKRAKPTPALPREIFLPAIDPAPYTAAAAKEPEEAMLPPPRPSGPPVDRLPALRWPRGFACLASYFDARMPVRLLDLPGFRFVQAAQGLYIGMKAVDGRVCSIAYAYDGNVPREAQQRCQPLRGVDGRLYQTVLMEV